MSLLAACSKNDLKQITELIAAGADLNEVNSDGATPTHYVCGRKNHIKALE